MTYYFLPHVGGGGISSYWLAKEMSKHVELSVAFPNVSWTNQSTSDFPEDLLFEVLKVGPPTDRATGVVLGPLWLFFKMVCSRKPAHFDLLICQYHPHHLTSTVTIMLSRIFHKPVIVRACDVYRFSIKPNKGSIDEIGSIVSLLVNTMNEHFLRFADSLDVVCSEFLDELQHRNVKLPRRVAISPNGFPSSVGKRISESDALSRLGLAGKRFLILMGRYGGLEYGVDIVVRGFELLAREFPDLILLLVGDDQGKESVRRIIPSYLSDRVMFLGATSQESAIALASSADACIGPLLATRTLPLKVVEYMALGRPVIAGVGSVTRDLARNGQNIVLVRPNVVDFAGAVRLILQDPDFRNLLCTTASRDSMRLEWGHIAMDLLAQGDVLLRARALFR